MASRVQTESAQRVSRCLNALLREQPIFPRAPAPSRSQPRDGYLGAREWYITTDANGSNGYLSRAWKHELQPFAGETGVCVHVNHLPPGTGKSNKIEHRLFCHLPQNWRGRPLRTFETIVDLIGNTRIGAGLRIRTELDEEKYPTGFKTTDVEMDAPSLHRDEFHGG